MNLGGLFEGPHLLIIGLIVFLIFGAKRLPELGKGLGEGLKGFKDGIKNVSSDASAPTTAQQTAPPAAPKAESAETKV
jgi:sec-independent protein translocase protein TatA